MEFLKAWSYSTIRLITVVIVVTCNSITCIGSVSANEKLLSAERQSEIQELIRQYIIDHPEVIVDSLKKQRDREEQERAERTQKRVISMRDQLANDPSSPVGGNRNGDVTIVEFFDYRCGYCKRVVPTILKILRTDSNVRYVFKEFPILGPDSVTATRAALAAWRIDPTKYQKLHLALMENRGQLTESKVMAFAAKIGLNLSDLKAAMQAPEIKETIEKNRQLAKALNINGTPAFVVGNELAPGAIDLAAFQRLILKARKTERE